MSGTLYEVDGTDVAGTTEYIFYKNGPTYTLLGSTNNTTAAVDAKTAAGTIAQYSDIVFLPAGESPADIVVFNQAGTAEAVFYRYANNASWR